jgi:hypothetical protein
MTLAQIKASERLKVALAEVIDSWLGEISDTEDRDSMGPVTESTHALMASAAIDIWVATTDGQGYVGT